MYLEKIRLKNIRNLKDIFLQLDTGTNIFVGGNGQGKTNLMEALYFLGTLTSHRTNISREIIHWDEDSAFIQVKLIKEDTDLKLSLKLTGSGKQARVNDTLLEKVTELVGKFNVVLFSPDDLQLVKGSPAGRRKFLDTEVSQVSSLYRHLLHKYKRIVKQRNNLLKEIRRKQANTDENMLAVWNEQLVETGSKIIKKRLEVIDKLKILARLAQRRITGGDENLSIDYKQSFSREFHSEGEINVIFEENLVNNKDREIERGYTLFGPHRDDLILKINDIDIRKFGSQGQQRTVALALKLAELEFMKSEVGEYPVLLLDDVFSELDSFRRSALMEVIVDNIQTFITTTGKQIDGLKDESGSFFSVEGGKISRKVK